MNTILEKIKELDNITDILYAARMRLECVEANIKIGDPFSCGLERLIDEALRLKREISELSADEFVLRYELNRKDMRTDKNCE